MQRLKGMGRSALAALAALVASASVGAAPAAAETLIDAGYLVTDADSEPLGPSYIIIKNGRIHAIVPADSEEARTYEAAAIDENGEWLWEYIDLSDKTVLPGLIDLHTHLSGDPSGEFWARGNHPARILHADRGQECPCYGSCRLYHGP